MSMEERPMLDVSSYMEFKECSNDKGFFCSV